MRLRGIKTKDEANAFLKDNVITYNGRLYQIKENNSKRVALEKRIDGSLLIMSKGETLKYEEISERPNHKNRPEGLQPASETLKRSSMK